MEKPPLILIALYYLKSKEGEIPLSYPTLTLDLETLKICEEESFYTRKIGKQKNENVEEKLLKTFPQSPTHGNRWL